MANVKNFGLIGVGSDLQLGKAGARIINNAGVFTLKAANGTLDAALTAAGITSSGNLNFSTDGGKVIIGGTDVLGKSANGHVMLFGTSGAVLPAGSTAERGTAELGQIRVNTDVSNQATVEYFDGDSWVTLATGGSTGDLQTEIDSIETSLGASVNSDGTFNGTAFSDSASGATSITDAINKVAAAVAGTDSLDEILPGTDGQIIYNSNGTWVTGAPGATSGVQGYDAGLEALATRTGTGILVQTGDDTYASRTLVAPAAGFEILDADGVAGNPTFALTDDLAAVEDLATYGFAVRTADNTWVTRDITGTAGRISVYFGNGVDSSPTIDLVEVGQADSGSFLKVTLDDYGRVVGSTAVVASDITGLVDGNYVNVTGDTMTGNLDMGNNKITGLGAPTAGGDATNKAYVDNAVTGLTWKDAVDVLANVDVPLSGAFSGLTIDGRTFTEADAGARVLLVAQTNDYENGIYVIGDAGAGYYTLTRSADTDAADGSELEGAAVFVISGTNYDNTGWVQSNHALTDFTGQQWVQFSGGGAYSAGNGLALNGTTFSVNMGAGITTLPSDEVGIDLQSDIALQLTTLDAEGQLTLVLRGGGGLEQDGTGLAIALGGVTNEKLANSSITLDADSGTGAVSLGGTLDVVGTAAQGISTSVASGTITITAADASTTQKGVASFDSVIFTATDGAVSLEDGGVANAKLANSSITFAGNTGTADDVALGETVTISSADSAITVTAGANALSIQLNTVDVTHGGTGLTSVAAGQVLFGGAGNTIAQDADFAFDAATNALTVGSASITGAAGGDVTIAATATNGDINLVPNGTGAVIIGAPGAGVIAADAGQTLTVTGNNTLILESTSGDVVLKLAAGTADKVTVSGPTAAQYATSLADADLTNKLYVDQAVATGGSGSIKAVTATVNLATAGTTDIGAALPAGATVLRVKVQVTSADTGTGTLSIGKYGAVAAYMLDTENDPQTQGMYIAETYAVEAASTQVIATVAGTTASGSAVVIVEYQLA